MSERMPHGPQIEDALVARMHADLTRRPWYTRWQWRLGLVGAGALVIGAGAFAGTSLLTHKPVSDTTMVTCASDAQLNPDGSLAGTAMSVATPEGVLAIDDAIAMCRLAWNSGAMTRTDPLDPSPPPGVAPSRFTLCVADDGTATVVPGDILCSSLRLHPWSAD
ncbi:hypothetical protein [Microbacterium sp. SORGH_AS_0888]|uniref:hypothetical protein n=1 Tax=Microbacterium sp. SORGH_AS_0888 TaxID=3041791 RepID=UPI00278ACE81|nr:hypothetical protein [Microbacterium sp. SORGH_AS_0888]MDQ1129427.1 hypothetical protein [Microbacterium sp. SORGH_AS_0888]